MALSNLYVIDYESVFRNSNPATRRIVKCDDVTAIFEAEANTRISMLMMDAGKDLHYIASCDCGLFMGNYFENLVCPECDSLVRTNFAEELEYHAWVQIPDILPPMLHPTVHRVLESFLGGDRKKKEEGLQGLIRKYGYRKFYENFIEIIAPYLEASDDKHIHTFFQWYQDRFFTRYLPVLNSTLHVITRSGTMRYSDNSAKAILDVCTALTAVYNKYTHNPTGPRYLDDQMLKIMDMYMQYIDTVFGFGNDKSGGGKLTGKNGLFRKNMLGGRFHNTTRAVIVPITDIHEGDEIHAPWRMGVEILKLEIKNRLMRKYRMSNFDAEMMQRRALISYNDRVDTCIKELIGECPEKGLPNITGRNPTLQMGAEQLLFTTQVKPDIHDDTIALSPMVINAPNADHD